ncbi:hypothetical protein Dimus_035481 [Dionaea muscipula]
MDPHLSQNDQVEMNCRDSFLGLLHGVHIVPFKSVNPALDAKLCFLLHFKYIELPFLEYCVLSTVLGGKPSHHSPFMPHSGSDNFCLVSDIRYFNYSYLLLCYV